MPGDIIKTISTKPYLKRKKNNKKKNINAAILIFMII